MNRLKDHVDRLFSGYEESNQIRELKEEILSNLEAKVADLTSRGMEYHQAVSIAEEQFDHIDGLIDDNKQVYTNKVRLELLQLTLLYTLIAWILTIPLRIVGMGILLNYVLLIVAFVSGIGFLFLNMKMKRGHWNKISVWNMKSALQYNRWVWILWGLFITVVTLVTTAARFGSNIWYFRPVSITGPYQWTVLAIEYALPFISVIIPLLFSTSIKLVQKYEAGESYEGKK
ncbi:MULTISPECIES: permease prefix domain 1-containing protein [unclassified Paenibacillus]|uniref:permease prefix domain 1-containing protein n=1 Tax=unclassified Paenibacillus TaxID=185978 RepID=UPI001AE482DB|nr:MULTISPECIES: permease prefix domain 1-containing protein [unclassified Paenibacillus]MBP1157384.1 hypothetical protein [Paenibacillus sp. PvP091]MBP1171878.1 hypothetical protein [Paenibacillus sp. PvR098]MBP2438259.1 hypothetical protein [Paenibacillus sp. PvP052]